MLTEVYDIAASRYVMLSETRHQCRSWSIVKSRDRTCAIQEPNAGAAFNIAAFGLAGKPTSATPTFSPAIESPETR